MVSIIIPVHNAYEYTCNCVESIKVNTTGDYEIVLIDNGSTDETKDIDVAVRFKENQGFAKAANKGIEISEGNYVCLLNNDVIVTPGALDLLKQHIDRNEMDIAGACTNFCAGKQQILIPEYDNIEELYQRAFRYAMQNKYNYEIADSVIGFCMMFRKKLLIDIGYFDEQFGLGNCEDIDFCMRAKKAGYKIGIAKDVYVHHFGGVTHKILGIDYNKLLKENQEKLEKKWK